jgi:hypothetical protein
MTRAAVGHWYIRESIRTPIPVAVKSEPGQLIQVSVGHEIELIAALRFTGWRTAAHRRFGPLLS